MTSSVSPYLQRPVRKLEEVKSEAKAEPAMAADDRSSAKAPSPSAGPHDTGDRR